MCEENGNDSFLFFLLKKKQRRRGKLFWKTRVRLLSSSFSLSLSLSLLSLFPTARLFSSPVFLVCLPGPDGVSREIKDLFSQKERRKGANFVSWPWSGIYVPSKLTLKTVIKASSFFFFYLE